MASFQPGPGNDKFSAGGSLSPESIREQTGRILASAAFQRSKRLSRFLTFAVENTLAGYPSVLKELVLGIEVFDRGAAFDPRNDPIVRIDARRLRARLAEYYEREGAADPIRIDFEPGSYVPQFRESESARTTQCGPQKIPRWSPVRSLAVLDLLRRGRHQLETASIEGIVRGHALFEQARAANPEHPVAHLGVAAASVLKALTMCESAHTAMSRARTAALRAIELDPGQAEAHAVLAIRYAVYDFDFPAANSEFLLALRLDSSSELALTWRAIYYLAPLGFLGEAVEKMRVLADREARTAKHWFNLGWLLYLKRDYSAAVSALETALHLNPRFVPARHRLSLAHERLGDYARAAEVLLPANLESGYPLLPLRNEALRLVRAGSIAEAQAVAGGMEANYAPGSTDPLAIAEVFGALGLPDRAFPWLEQALEDRRSTIVHLRSDPAFDPLRTDPRFAALAAQAGLRSDLSSDV